MNRRDEAHAAGCLLGGAAGDALGASVEFMSLRQIQACFGSEGIRNYAPAFGGIGRFTDDTQMTLFTAEGIIEGVKCGDRTRAVYRSYLRWLATQGWEAPGGLTDIYCGRLFETPGLRQRRGPGRTCLTALASGEMGTVDRPINDSKGCGGVMRAAPAGIVDPRVTGVEPFRLGCEIAAITHGHPSGYLSAGFLADMICEILEGAELREAISHARTELICYPQHEECLRAVDAAVQLAGAPQAGPEQVAQLGEGWVAEEALAIAVYCALKAEDFAFGIRLAVNHGGDSDSTGAITGNILGALWGKDGIPHEFLDPLELADLIEDMARELLILG